MKNLDKRCYIVKTVLPNKCIIKCIVEGYDKACILLEKNKATAEKYGLDANCWLKRISRKNFYAIKENGFIDVVDYASNR